MVLLLFILQYLFIKLVEGQKEFYVQVFPAGYIWNVSVTSGDSLHSELTNGGILKFDLDQDEPIKSLIVEINSCEEILGYERSQTWTLYPVEKGRYKTKTSKKTGKTVEYEVNVLDFTKVHQFHFGQYIRMEGNDLYLNIQLNNAEDKGKREKYFAIVKTQDGFLSQFTSKPLYEEELVIDNYHLNSRIFQLSLAKEAKSSIIKTVTKLVTSPRTSPRGSKSPFSKSKSFDKTEPNKDKTESKKPFMRSLSNLASTPSKLKAVFGKSQSFNEKMSSNSPGKAESPRATETQQTLSSIEEFIQSKEIPVLDVCIEKRIKCHFCKVDKYFNEIYLLNSGSNTCSKCFHSMQDDSDWRMDKVEIPLPKLCRKIANPVLQNGTGQEFTYIFDFMKVQDKKTNINFVQLADFSGSMEEGFRTPMNLLTNFAHLNLEEAESSTTGGTKSRKSFAGFEGLKLNFDDIDDQHESSAPSNIPRPRKSNAQRPMERQGVGRQTPHRASVDIPSSSRQGRNSGIEDLQRKNNSAKAKKNFRRNSSMPMHRSNPGEDNDGEGQASDNYPANTHTLSGVGSQSFDGIQGTSSDQSNWSGIQGSGNIPPLFPQESMTGSFPQPFQPGSVPHTYQPGPFPQPIQPGVHGNLPVYNHLFSGQELYGGHQMYGDNENFQGYQYPPPYPYSPQYPPHHYSYPPHHQGLNAQHGSVHNVPQTSTNEAAYTDADTPNVVYYPQGYQPPHEREPSYSYHMIDGKWVQKID